MHQRLPYSEKKKEGKRGRVNTFRENFRNQIPNEHFFRRVCIRYVYSLRLLMLFLLFFFFCFTISLNGDIFADSQQDLGSKNWGGPIYRKLEHDRSPSRRRHSQISIYKNIHMSNLLILVLLDFSFLSYHAPGVRVCSSTVSSNALFPNNE